MEPTDATITAEQVPGLLLAALPSLSDEWVKIAVDHDDPGIAGARLDHLDADWVVGHLADRLAAGDTTEFDSAFDFIESLLLHGDPYVSDLGMRGYLEGLQSETVTSRGVDPQAFQPWMRPRSAKYWEVIHSEPPTVTYGPWYGPRLEWENMVLLQALHASQGQIGDSVRGIAVEAGYELVLVHACVANEDPETREDLEEVADDLETALEQFTDPPPTVELRVHVGDTDPSWSGYDQPRLYLMHWRAREGYVPE